jgi:hypothetical protein
LTYNLTIQEQIFQGRSAALYEFELVCSTGHFPIEIEKSLGCTILRYL